jgi:hypothetical protein
MRFDVGWPVVMQERRGEPKRAVHVSYQRSSDQAGTAGK